MQTVTRILGQLLLAIAGLWGVVLVATLVGRDGTAALGTVVLAGLFALPGWLLYSYSVVAERRAMAEALIKDRERFSIEDIAKVLRSSPEQAHAFIAEQIARHGLGLSYQEATRGYARRGLAGANPPPPPPGPAPVSEEVPAAPCASCGSTQPATETGFCPTCGARRDAAGEPKVRA